MKLERRKQAHHERIALSTARAEEMLRSPPIRNTSANIRTIFGVPNLQFLSDYLTLDKFIDVDAAFLSSKLSEDEYIQYVNMLFEEEDISVDLMQIAEMFMEALRPRFDSIIESELRSDKKCDLHTINNLIVHLDYFGRDSFSITAPYRTHIMRKFVEILLILFFREIKEKFDSFSIVKERKGGSEYFDHRFEKLHESCKERNKVGHSAWRFLKSKKILQDTLHHSYFSKVLAKGFPPVNVESDEEKVEVEQVLGLEFEEIRELARYRKITFARFIIGEEKSAEKCELAINGDEFFENNSASTYLCNISLTLDPLETLTPPKLKNKMYTLMQRIGTVNFSIDRKTGELQFFTNPSFCVRKFFSENQYLGLKSAIYACLLKYLRNKEPDIEDLFTAYSGERTSTGPDTVVTDLTEGSHEIIATTLQEEINIEQPPSKEIKTLTNQTGNEIGGVLHKSSPDSYHALTDRKELIDRIKGLRGQKALATLQRLFGESVRIRGSHYFFVSDRNGRALPFPIHRTDINPYIFMRNITLMGYSLDEFCRIM